MGSSVREPGVDAPDQWRVERCPHCGAKRELLNGAYLRWKRERAGLDQRTFAKRLGVSGAYLSDIERNRRDCPATVEVAYRKLKPR